MDDTSATTAGEGTPPSGDHKPFNFHEYMNQKRLKHRAAKGLPPESLISGPPPRPNFPPVVYIPHDIDLDDPQAITLYELEGRKIVRYGDKLVKTGPTLLPTEAENMRFIARKTHIPVPKVYAYKDGSIIMEYIEGDRLDKIWNEMTKEQRLDIISQLKGILCELYALEGEYIGSLNRGQADDGRMLGHLKGGPFDTETDFNEFLLANTVVKRDDIISHVLSNCLRTDHKNVFAHSDFAPRNMLVKDGKIVAMLDWEWSGWYPEYWDYVRCIANGDRHANEWYQCVNSIFPKTYEQEFVTDSFLDRILRHSLPNLRGIH